MRTNIHVSAANDKALGGLHQLQVLSHEYEQKLRELVQSGASLEKIAAVLERSGEIVRVKMKCLKLVVVDHVNFKWTTTSKLPVDDELQSVEARALKPLKAALKALLFLGFSS